MKYLLFALTAFTLISCSSAPKKVDDSGLSDVDSVSNADFKKETPLQNSQLRDYFTNNQQVLENPILKDETLTRLTSDEMREFEKSGDPLISMAYLCTKKQFTEAFAIAEKNFDRFQKVAAYWNQLGICYLDNAEERRALLYFNKALEAEKNYVPTLNNFGVMYTRQGQHQKAIVAFEKASQVGKFSKTPRYNLAKLYLEYGLSEKALPILKSLSNQSQTDIGVTNSIATAYLMQGDFQTAIRFFKQLPPKTWERAEIGINVAFAYHIAGSPKDAAKIFNNITKPKQTELKNYYSSMAHKMGVKL